MHKRNPDGSYVCRKGHVISEPKHLTTNGNCRQCSRVSVEPGEGVECLICGDVLRTLVSNHIQMLHGITPAEYRERFPGAPTVGRIYREIRRDMWDDRITEGNPVQKPERMKGARGKMCAKGLHAMKGKNIVWVGEGERRRRQCRECKRIHMAKWSAENGESKREYMRRYYEENREARQAYDRTRDLEKRRATNRKSYKKNIEKRKAAALAYREKNRERFAEYARQYRAKKRLQKGI